MLRCRSNQPASGMEQRHLICFHVTCYTIEVRLAVTTELVKMYVKPGLTQLSLNSLFHFFSKCYRYELGKGLKSSLCCPYDFLRLNSFAPDSVKLVVERIPQSK